MLALLLTVAVVLSGCSSQKSSPKEALQASMSKASEMKSYSFKGSMKFEEFNFGTEGMTAEESAAMLNTLKNAELTWTGAYQADPLLAEINLQLALKGDMAINFSVPIVMNKEKIWVKIPNIPMLPLPETVVGKYLELDMKELAEQSGQPLPSLDIGKQQKFGNDVMGIVFKHIEEDKYLSSVKEKDAGLPEGVDVNQVVQFKLDKAQIEPFIKTVVEKIAPEVIDLLSKNSEYRDMLQLTQEDLDAAKKDLEEAKGEDLSKGLEEMNKELKSFNLTANIGLDKKEYPVYTDAKISAEVDIEGGEKGNFAIKLVSETNDINEKVKFEIGTPKAEDIITMQQMEEQMGGMFGADSL